MRTINQKLSDLQIATLALATASELGYLPSPTDLPGVSWDPWFLKRRNFPDAITFYERQGIDCSDYPYSLNRVWHRTYLRSQIARLADQLGHTPTPLDFFRAFKRELNKDASRFGFNSSNDLLTYLNFPLPPDPRSKLRNHLGNLGFEFLAEHKVSDEPRRFIDFLVNFDGHLFALEVQGSSHYSAESVYHKVWSSDKSVSFAAKLERDAYVKQCCASLGYIYVDVEHWHFLSLDRAALLQVFRERAQGVQPTRQKLDAHQRYDIGQIQEWLYEGESAKGVARKLGVSQLIVQRLIQRHSLVNPKARKAPSELRAYVASEHNRKRRDR